MNSRNLWALIPLMMAGTFLGLLAERMHLEGSLREAARDQHSLAEVTWALQSQRSKEAQALRECEAMKCDNGLPYIIREACWCIVVAHPPVKP